MIQAGYRDGITSGKQSTLQIGFDQGFSAAAPVARKIGALRAMANGLLALFITTAGAKHSAFLDSTSATTSTETPRIGLNEQQREELVVELRSLVSTLNKLLESTTLPPDQEAIAHSKTHDEDPKESMSLERLEKSEMDEIQGLLGGIVVEKGNSMEVETPVKEIGGDDVVRECEERLEGLLRRCGLEGVLQK